MKKDFDAAEAFLDAAARRIGGTRSSSGTRAGSTTTSFDALRAHDVAMCIIEQPDFASPVVATASWGYMRLHRFDYDDADARRRGRRQIAAQPWSDAYVFFKHDEGVGSGPPAVDAFIAGCRRIPRI